MKLPTFPIFVENSRLPALLSRIAPIEIAAINLALWVFARKPLSVIMRRHETIHYRQQRELLFVGQWLLYALFWLILLIKYKGDGKRAYRANPFELEAYIWQSANDYLDNRPLWAWWDYLSVLSPKESEHDV